MIRTLLTRARRADVRAALKLLGLFVVLGSCRDSQQPTAALGRGTGPQAPVSRARMTGEGPRILGPGVPLEAPARLRRATFAGPRLSAPGGVETVPGKPANAGAFVLQVFVDNPTNGDHSIWYLDASGSVVATYLYVNLPLEWHVVGAADFNGDGFEDILWENSLTGNRAIWFMDGSGFVITSGSLGIVATQWHIDGARDYSGDGVADILFENTVTGDRVVWIMAGTTKLSEQLIANRNPQHTMIAAGDINGDGKNDIAIQNMVTGERMIWLMNGLTIADSAIGFNIPTNWHMGAVGDINGDGHADILWEDLTNGNRAAWLLNGWIIGTPLLLNAPTQLRMVGILVPQVTPAPSPGTVNNLAVQSTTSTSATLTFTQVGDGMSAAARYDIRFAVAPFAWGSAPSVSSGTCASPLLGTVAGAPLTCTVTGLAPSTTYNFELVPYRDNLGLYTFGGLSNVVAGTTQAPSVATVTVTPPTVNVPVGGTTTLTATLRDALSNVISGPVNWASSNNALATVSGAGVVSGVAAGAVTITASSGVPSGTSVVTVQALPGTVNNLNATASTASSVTLSFTQVTNGIGGAASYDVRYAAGGITFATATRVTSGTCTVPVAGTTVGTTKTCTVTGLAPGTSYSFQLVAFRGTLDVNSVAGAVSNIATRSTTGSAVNSVTVSPPYIATFVGAVQAFTATVRDAAGTIMTGQTITWSSSAPTIATVSAAGVDSAIAPGLVTITASTGGKSGSAIDTVLAVPSGPSGGGGGGGSSALWPNEPSGMTVLTDHGFDAAVPVVNGGAIPGLTGWSAINPAGTIARITDPGAPFSPTYVLQATYPIGFAAGPGVGTMYYTHAPATEMFVGFVWKVGSPYQYSNVFAQKIGYAVWNESDNTFLGLDMYGSEIAVIPVRWPVDQILRPGPSSGGTKTDIQLNTWYRLEYYFKYSTTSTSHDGIVRWWVSSWSGTAWNTPVLQGNITNIQSPANNGGTMFQVYTGWSGSLVKTEVDHTYYDHVRVSRR